jgi:CheY-like chemotaxis protein
MDSCYRSVNGIDCLHPWLPPGGSLSKPASILVADPIRDCADAVVMMLSSSGLRACAVYDGTEAISMAAALKPDSAVLDLEMPGATGFEVARELRRTRGRAINLVAYTAWPAELVREKVTSAGFDELVPKTCDVMDLLRAVSPECYGDLLRSMQASAAQLRLQITLAHTLLDHAGVASTGKTRDDLRRLVETRVPTLEEALAHVMIASDRDTLRAELEALRRRVKPG